MDLLVRIWHRASKLNAIGGSVVLLSPYPCHAAMPRQPLLFQEDWQSIKVHSDMLSLKEIQMKYFLIIFLLGAMLITAGCMSSNQNIPIIPAQIATASNQCHQEAYQEEYQTPIQFSYQEYQQTPIPVEYNWSHSPRGEMCGLDFEIIDIVTIHNVDSAGGIFTVTTNFYDGNTLQSNASSQGYIGPREPVIFYPEIKGLPYSKDWRTRYTIKNTILPPPR